MKSQFHHDYPRVLLLSFVGFIGYSAGTISGAVIAFSFALWICVIIVCAGWRVVKRVFVRKPKAH